MSRRRKRPAGAPGSGGSPVMSGQVIDPREVESLRIMRTGEQIQIGDLDEQDERPEVTATFRLKDPKTGERVTLRVNPDLTEVVVIDLLEQADRYAADDPKSMTIVKTYAMEHVHPEDRDRFWGIVKAKRLDTAGVMVLCWNILGGVTANPTTGQSVSSDGPPATSTPSQPASSTPAAAPSGVPSDPDGRRAAFLAHIDRIQSRTGEDGKVLPINAAVAAQLATAAEAQGIDLTSSRSAAATG